MESFFKDIHMMSLQIGAMNLLQAQSLPEASWG